MEPTVIDADLLKKQSRSYANMRYYEKNRDQINFLTIIHDIDLEAIQTYKANNRSNEKRWEVVTGDPTHIEELIQNGFHIPLKEKVEPNRYILVDNNGQIRGYYTASNQSELSRLSMDVEGLMRIS